MRAFADSALVCAETRGAVEHTRNGAFLNLLHADVEFQVCGGAPRQRVGHAPPVGGALPRLRAHRRDLAPRRALQGKCTFDPLDELYRVVAHFATSTGSTG